MAEWNWDDMDAEYEQDIVLSLSPRSSERAQYLRLDAVRDLIEQMVGVYGDDWQVKQWGQEYEGWVASFRPTCFANGGSCVCCDGSNLEPKSVALLAQMFDLSDSVEGQP